MAIWKSIKGYDNQYWISDEGQVISLGNKTRKTRILKAKKNRYGYLEVSLYKDGKGKTYLIHRLVAEAFIPNPDNLPCVNHKSEIKTENQAFNLEWCSISYNNTYGTAIERSRLKRLNGKGSKPIIQKTLKNEIVAEYPSIKEAARQTGYFKQGIIPCLKGKQKQAYGYLWCYKEERAA